MEIEFILEGVLVKGGEFFSTTVTDNYIVIIEKRPKTHSEKKAVVNALVHCLWNSRKSRERYQIE